MTTDRPRTSEPPEPFARLLADLEGRGFTRTVDEEHPEHFGNRVIEVSDGSQAARLWSDRTLQGVTRDLTNRYGDVEAVQELNERLRGERPPIGDGHRYVTCRSMTNSRKVHQADCPTLNRGQASRAMAWEDGDGLEPAEVLVRLAARPRQARPWLEACQTCIGGRRARLGS